MKCKLNFGFMGGKYYIIPKGQTDMNEKIKEELDKIVSVLAETGVVAKIILFGSYARGEETPDSDIDLCVLTPVRDRRPIDITIDLRGRIYDIQETPLDLFTRTQDDFSYRAAYVGSLEHEIAREGRVLYEHK
jgi:predicted nucleotidyltransferase